MIRVSRSIALYCSGGQVAGGETIANPTVCISDPHCAAGGSTRSRFHQVMSAGRGRESRACGSFWILMAARWTRRLVRRSTRSEGGSLCASDGRHRDVPAHLLKVSYCQGPGLGWAAVSHPRRGRRGSNGLLDDSLGCGMGVPPMVRTTGGTPVLRRSIAPISQSSRSKRGIRPVANEDKNAAAAKVPGVASPTGA